MYDASLGRFLSVDPVLSPSDPQQNNGYSYAHNDPVSMSDPTGLDPNIALSCNSLVPERDVRRQQREGTGRGNTTKAKAFAFGPVVEPDHVGCARLAERGSDSGRDSLPGGDLRGIDPAGAMTSMTHPGSTDLLPNHPRR
jgi:hypothetical protein